MEFRRKDSTLQVKYCNETLMKQQRTCDGDSCLFPESRLGTEHIKKKLECYNRILARDFIGRNDKYVILVIKASQNLFQK